MSEVEDRANHDDWETHVRKTAGMVESGVFPLDEVQALESHEETDEEMRKAVRGRLDDSVTTETVQDEGGAKITATAAIDWRSLFEEFGFHTPGPNGDLEVSPLKMREAIRVSQQNIAGDPDGHLDRAVENGLLVEKMATAHRSGTEVTAGYHLGGDV